MRAGAGLGAAAICAILAGCGAATPQVPTNDEALRSLLVKSMLDSYDDREFSKMLRTHGPITDADVPQIVEASKEFSSKRRRNAAMLMLLLRSEKSAELQLQTVTETKDADAWGILIGGFGVLDRHPDWAGKRPDMIKKGLESSKPVTLAAAVRAGAISKYPGIDAVIEKLIDHPEPKVREAALASLTPEMTERVRPRLMQMMRDIKKMPRYDSSGYRGILVMGLLATGDPAMRKEIREYYEEGPDDGRLEFASLLNTHEDVWIEEYLWELWQTPDKNANEEKYKYPVQFNALGTAIWQIVEKRHFQPKARWAQACIDIPKMSKHSGSAIDEDCAKLAYFVSGQKHGREWLDDKAWTNRTLQTWLKAQPK